MLDLLQFVLSGAWEFVGTTWLILLIWIYPLRIIAVAWERRNRPIVLDKETGEKVKAS
jgi:hypothetical protein